MTHLHDQRHQFAHSRLLHLALYLVALALSLSLWRPALADHQVDIPAPEGSSSFGSNITVLPNGNFVVIDQFYDTPGGATSVGAVHLYNGSTHALISTLTGNTQDDQVGSGGIVVLINGNFLVVSPNWHNGAVPGASAVTWVNGMKGLNGVVSSSNSLVGSTTDDGVGSDNKINCFDFACKGIIELKNGNYLVMSYKWDNGAATDAGAVTWGSGTSGVSGVLGSNNSLVGSKSADRIGSHGIVELTNGNYVVVSPYWINGLFPNAGAVTWGNGSSGVSGVVSSSNSLVGNRQEAYIGFNSGDSFGTKRVIALPNGNYVVSSPLWDRAFAQNAGAVTWGDGSKGISGPVTSSNSLVGSTADDSVGYVYVLTNGNYVVQSNSWDNGSTSNVGAVTWGSGSSGVVGEISSSNSLIGSTQNDGISFRRALSNGNYLVGSSSWDNGNAQDAGAVAWADGTTGTSGVINSTNSLVGSKSDDKIGGYSITKLSNGNYVVVSSEWDNGGAVDAGAVTWGNGMGGTSGPVSNSNSLIGSRSDDKVGYGSNGTDGLFLLTNGNYVVVSPEWNNGSAIDAGAVTWGDGASGVSGVVSSNNSLVGSKDYDLVGGEEKLPPPLTQSFAGVVVLSNGNYVVRSPYWDFGIVANVGAITWGNGIGGSKGAVSSQNSLVGTAENHTYDDVVALSNGNYLVVNSMWNNGSATSAGAVTWANGASGLVGTVNASNSLVGSQSNDRVGIYGIIDLQNGNYLVRSPNWHNGNLENAGAVTWGNGATGTMGTVSSSNSLIGSHSNDNIGKDSFTKLKNGSYILEIPEWDNGAMADAGAVTFISVTNAIRGEVSSSNSLVGSQSGDSDSLKVVLLSNGNFVVARPSWNNDGFALDAGAVTWGDGNQGVSGEVSDSNSLVGMTSGNRVGEIVTALSDGSYVVHSPHWDNEGMSSVGAGTWGSSTGGAKGIINNCNSVLGAIENYGFLLKFAHDLANQQLVVGKEKESKITLFRPCQPEIEMQGNGQAIVDGDITPSSADGSDFASLPINNAALTHTFTISNPGESELVLTGALAVTLSDNTHFQLTQPASMTLSSGTSTTFQVTFDPVASGLFTTEVTILSNDSDENPYIFILQGHGLKQYTLSTASSGDGSGTLSLDPPGGSYSEDTAVTISATASSGSNFTEWSGDCTGTGACVVTMDRDKAVTAIFAKVVAESENIYLPLVTR